MLTKNKGARSREPLSLNMTATGSASLLKAAQIRDDRRLLLQIHGQDTIAIDKSCYVQYVEQEHFKVGRAKLRRRGHS